LPKITDLPRGFWWVLYPMTGGVATGATAVAAWIRGNSSGAYDNGFTAMMYAIITFLIVLFALHRLTRYIVFEVEAGELRLIRVWGGKGHPHTTWNRDELRDVHLNHSNGKLWISLHDKDAVEIYLTSHSAVNRWIADRVRGALYDPELIAECPHTDQVLSYASTLSVPQRSSNGKLARRVGIVATVLLMSVGVVLLCTPLGPVGFMIFLFAGIPAGLALGTQKKDYYM
jgi:hypothetical protein